MSPPAWSPRKEERDCHSYEIPSANAIAKEAFYGFSELETITISNIVEIILDEAFRDCISLRKINFAANSKLNILGPMAFSCCSSLTTIVLPDTLTIIGDSAFDGCVSLKTCKLGPVVQKIGEKAFFACKLLQSIMIPYSVLEIGKSAFNGCRKLVSIEFEKKNLTQIKVLTQHVFAETGLVNIDLPSGIETIDTEAFLNCVDLVEVTTPATLKMTNARSFAGCPSLTDAMRPSRVFDSSESSDKTSLFDIKI